MSKRRSKHRSSGHRQRIDKVLRYFIIFIGFVMIVEAAFLYSVTDSIRSVISPDMLSVSLSYVFIRVVVGIIFMYYAIFHTEHE